MKTTRAARRYVRARFTVICLAVLTLAALDLGVAGSLVGRVSQTSSFKTGSPPIPEVGISDFTAAAAAVR